MDRLKRKWLFTGAKMPRSTKHYREKYKKKKTGGEVSAAPNMPVLLAPKDCENVIIPPQHQQVCCSESDESVVNNTSTTEHTFNQLDTRSAFTNDVQSGDEDHTMESDGEILECPGMFSATDGSTDDQVGPKEPVLRVKRRKLRKKTIAKENLDSDDAFTSSSESSGSCHSVLSDCTSPEPVPSRVPTPDIFRSDDEYEILEEGTSRQDKQPGPRKDSKPLCPCTDTTAEEVMFMTLTLGLRHGLTWVAQVDILKMISTIFKNDSIPTTKHCYKERLNVEDEKDILYHVFCSECEEYLGEKPKKAKTKYCPSCEKNSKISASTNCFVSLSLEAQLQKFLLDDYFVSNILTYRFKQSSVPGTYRDIYDGNVYKKLSTEGGVLSSPYNFSVTFFTDGVAFGKSSNKTVWPIYLTVNELPYPDRKKYFILAGVYSGPKDPNQLYFLKPFVEAMNNLSSNGVRWVHNGSEITSIVIPICCVVDSVARYQILNYKSFFGDYGCTFCYRHSYYIAKTGSRYPVCNEPAPCRSENEYKADILAVLAKPNTVDRAHRGVKGTCNLYSLKYFSIFHSLTVDYMHNALLGCAKKHTELILESTRKKMWVDVYEKNIGIKTLKGIIDGRIASLQSSTSVIRELRGISHLSLWRATEWRMWLLFYFVTCLKGLLKEKFILHFALLSKAFSLLLQRSVTDESIKLAHRLLMYYTFYFQKCFGEKNMVYNIHLLSHIGQSVYNFGPIWGHNSFMYESENRYLLQLCKSPNSVSLQVARKFVIFQTLPYLGVTLDCSERVIDFSESILNYKRLVKCHRANNNQCVLLGQPTLCEIPNHIKQQLETTSNSCLLYKRMLYKQKKHSTVEYSKEMANNDSHLFLFSGECVTVHKIIKIPDVKVVLLFVQIVALDRRPLYRNDLIKYDCISKVLRFDEFRFVRLEEIAEPCLPINVNGEVYIARIPYGCTVE